MEEPCRSAASLQVKREAWGFLREMQKGEEEGCKLKEETDTKGRRGRMQIEGRESRDRYGKEKRNDENWRWSREGHLWRDSCGREKMMSLPLCSLVWATASVYNWIRVRHLGMLIYTTGSVHRFKWSNRNRTEPVKFYGFSIGLIGFL